MTQSLDGVYTDQYCTQQTVQSATTAMRTPTISPRPNAIIIPAAKQEQATMASTVFSQSSACNVSVSCRLTSVV